MTTDAEGRVEEELEIALGLAAEAVETGQLPCDLATLLADGREVLRSRLSLVGGSDKERFDHQAEVFGLLGRALVNADALVVVLDERARPAAPELEGIGAGKGPDGRRWVLGAALARRPVGEGAGLDTKFVIWSYRHDEGGRMVWDPQVVTRWGAQVLRRRRVFSPVFEAVSDGLGQAGLSAAAAERRLADLGQQRLLAREWLSD